MPNLKLETYKNKVTGTVYDYTDAAAQAALADILDGTDIDSFGDVETALATKVDKVTGKGLSTNDYDDTEKAKVAGAFPRSEQAVLGAKNFLYTDENTKTYEGVTYTVNRDTKGNITSVDVSGTPTAYTSIQFWADIKPNVYKISHIENAANIVWGEITLFKNGVAVQDLPSLGTVDDTIVDLRGYDFDKFKITVKRVTNGVNTTATIYPMLRLASDPDDTYVPYAMTNRELTEKFGDKVDFNAIFLPAKFADVYTGDLNDLPCGVRYIGANAANSPHDWSIVITFSTSGSDMPTAAYGAQIAIGSGYSGMYYRRKDNGTWQNWQSITLS